MARKAKIKVVETETETIQEPVQEIVETETVQEPVQEVVETEVENAEWIDPIKWIDETPTLDQAMTSLVTTKVMKKVKTVKTGVGQQILLLLAQGELSNKEIVAKVLEDNPMRKTTYACVAWYQSQVRAGKIDLPEVLSIEEPTEQEQE